MAGRTIAAAPPAADRPAPVSGRARLGLPRRLALLGGTTDVGDVRIALRCLADARALVHGPAIGRYERAFAERIGVRFAHSFSAGRVGLYGLLRALGVGPGDDVLLQAPTHIVVANAIRFVGARPVYVDCRLDTFNMDMEAAEARVTPRTKALVLQHTFGVPADLDRALELARRRGLALIEDCVHALGATYRGRPVGGFGRAAFFSTEETKTISTTMGGMAVTDDPALAERMGAFQEECAWPPRRLVAGHVVKLALYHVLLEPRLHSVSRALYEAVGRRHPLPRPTDDRELRGERPADHLQRLSNAQALLGLRQLRRLDENLAHRARIARLYNERLSALGVAAPALPPELGPAYVRYPVWVSDRDAVVRAARRQAVMGTWFTSVLEEALSPAHGGYETGSCPRAEAAAHHLVNLPTHPRVTPDDADALVRIIADQERRVGS